MERIQIEGIQAIRMATLGMILMAQSVFDIKTKQLPLWITGIGAAIGILYWIMEGGFAFLHFTGIIPGLLCLVIAKASRQAIGYGDGLLLCMMGVYLKLGELIGVCLWAFTIAGIAALFLLITKKKKGKQEIPFVPFLLLGFILEVLLC